MPTEHKANEAFMHVMEVLFKLEDDEPIYKALTTCGLNHPGHLMAMMPYQFNALT